MLPEFGMEGQLRLKDAAILVVGAGGLGCPALQYLAAAGIGRLGIADADRVDISNLQRQILYGTSDIGKWKADLAAQRVRSLNPFVQVDILQERITRSNAEEIMLPYDVVIDASDNFPTRYLLNDACILLNKPLVHGSVLRFEGHVAVFNIRSANDYSSNYRDLYPEPPDAEVAPNCEQAGVLGVMPGIIGGLQALEAIKLISGVGQVLKDRLLIVDGETMEFTLVTIKNRGSRQHVKGLIDYEIFCKSEVKSNTFGPNHNPGTMKEITVQQLKKMLEENTDFQLIDVREPHEYDICNLDGELIPLSQVPHNVDKFDREKMVVVHCRSGKRSGDSILWLEQNHGFTNLYNLKGGILAWAREIDTDMPTY